MARALSMSRLLGFSVVRAAIAVAAIAAMPAVAGATSHARDYRGPDRGWSRGHDRDDDDRRDHDRRSGGTMVDVSIHTRTGPPACVPPAQPHVQRVWVEPVYRTVTEQQWIPPVYRTVTDRVWREPVVQTVVDRVWVPDRCGWRETVQCGPWGRRVVREWVVIEPGHYVEQPRQVVVAPGHYEDVQRQELVCDGRWQTVQRQELVAPGHWQEVVHHVPAPQPIPRERAGGWIHIGARF